MKTEAEIWGLYQNRQWDVLTQAIESGELPAEVRIRPPAPPGYERQPLEQLGICPLYVAVQNGNVPLTRALLSRGKDPNVKTERQTLLGIAAAQGCLPVVELLLAAGADVNKKTDGQTPLMLAAAQRKPAVVKRLLAAGARVADRTSKGMSALSFACTLGDLNLENIDALLAAGSPVDGRDLHVAVALREVEAVRRLLTAQPDVNQRFDWSAP